MIYTEELRSLASAAFDLGYRTRFLAIPEPTWRDRFDAQYGPVGEGWRWRGPWHRFTAWSPYDTTKRYAGWERYYETPAIDTVTGEVLMWDISIISLFDEPVPEFALSVVS